jgi:hypothetical protein
MGVSSVVDPAHHHIPILFQQFGRHAVRERFIPDNPPCFRSRNFPAKKVASPAFYSASSGTGFVDFCPGPAYGGHGENI